MTGTQRPLTIWGRRSSSNVQAVMWAIAEMGLPFERHDVGHRYGGTDTPEFAALNPNRTIPVLQDGDGPALWESGAILRYLAGRYGSEHFWPSDPVARADVDRWAEWAKINIALTFTAPIFWRVVRTRTTDRDPAAITAAVAQFERKLTIAEQRLTQHRFLAGDSFTLADIQFGHILWRYFDIDIDRQEMPAVTDYAARLMGRPAYRDNVVVSYEELRPDEG